VVWIRENIAGTSYWTLLSDPWGYSVPTRPVGWPVARTTRPRPVPRACFPCRLRGRFATTAHPPFCSFSTLFPQQQLPLEKYSASGIPDQEPAGSAHRFYHWKDTPNPLPRHNKPCDRACGPHRPALWWYIRPPLYALD